MINIKKNLSLVMIILISLFLISCHKKIEIKVIHHQGKYGIAVSEKLTEIKVNNKEINLYQTTAQEVKFSYESYNLDNEFNNTVTINGYPFALLASNDNQNEFINNELTLIGLLIKPIVTVEIKSGINGYGGYDNFHLRNIYFKLAILKYGQMNIQKKNI